MIADGLEVLVEVGAGENSYYHDDAYLEAGAQMVSNVEEIYLRADIILKVKEPQFNHQKQT